MPNTPTDEKTLHDTLKKEGLAVEKTEPRPEGEAEQDVPHNILTDLFLTEDCVLCKGEKKGKRAWYAVADLANIDRLPKPEEMGRGAKAREKRSGAIFPLQLACCDSCRKKYLLVQYVSPVITAAGMTFGLLLMGIRPLREALMAVAAILPPIVFLVFTVGSMAVGKLLRKYLVERFARSTYLSVLRLEPLRPLVRMGWFELYDGKGVTRLVFSKKRMYSGARTRRGTADEEKTAATLEK